MHASLSWSSSLTSSPWKGQDVFGGVFLCVCVCCLWVEQARSLAGVVLQSCGHFSCSYVLNTKCNKLYR